MIKTWSDRTGGGRPSDTPPSTISLMVQNFLKEKLGVSYLVPVSDIDRELMTSGITLAAMGSVPSNLRDAGYNLSLDVAKGDFMAQAISKLQTDPNAYKQPIAEIALGIADNLSEIIGGRGR